MLGLGHHFPGSLDMAMTYHGPQPSRATRSAHHAFFPSNLNHTLKSLLTARRLWGHPSPERSVLLVGTTTPVAGCSRFSAPIDLPAAVAAIYDHRRTVDSPMWLSYARMNLVASWVARGSGVHFLDVAAPSAQVMCMACSNMHPLHVCTCASS